MIEHMPDQCAPSEASQETERAPTSTAHFVDFLRRWSFQDWLVLTYLVYLNLAILPQMGSAEYVVPATRMAALLAYFLVVVVSVRAGWLKDGFFGPLAYRLSMQGTVKVTYFCFLTYLPLANPRDLDQWLYALDLRWFGFEPSVWLDQFITPLTAEWFAFFYFCYFFVLVVHLVPILIFGRHERILGEFGLGMLLVFCVGQFLYTLVPGFGPYRAIAHLFERPLPSGYWVNTVLETVKTGGAQKDIFPSIHTAAPTFITLFSFRNRAHLPYRYTWPIMAFFTVNIVIATMFMRWHWLIDVVAGLLLAAVAFGLSVAITRYDLKRRARLKMGPCWPVFERVPGIWRGR